MADESSNKPAERGSIIESVKTPLGFFTLGVLVVEAIMGMLIPIVEGTNQTLLIVGMIAVLLFLFLLVSWILLFKAEVLRPRSAGALDEDVQALVEYSEHNAALARYLVGRWRYEAITEIGDKPAVKTSGTCDISMSNISLELDGNWADEDTDSAGSWHARQLSLSEHELVYLFEAPEKFGVASEGVTKLRITDKDDNRQQAFRMAGFWSVLGKDTHGRIEFDRDAD
jgi:hypothetical protein